MVHLRSLAVVLAVMIVALLANQASATANTEQPENMLSLDLAMEAASEAVKVCAAQGWYVSVSIVDSSGNVKVQVKGDHSSIHTKDSSFRKAYTQVGFGPMFGFDALSVWVEKLKTDPRAAAFATLPNIILLPGAVAVKVKGETVAAIGVGGAPGGEKDEACARKGLDKITSRLPQ